jgi:hypothetical protein
MSLDLAGEIAMKRLFRILGVISLCALVSHNVVAQQISELYKARALAVKVNNVLTDYVEIHNDIFKVSPERVTPIPGVFETIDFQSHISQLHRQRQTLASTDREIAAWLREGIKDPKVRTFISLLRNYDQALSKAISQLEEISQELYKKSQNSAHYLWDVYTRDIDAYQKSIGEYQRLGSALNEAYQTLTE